MAASSSPSESSDADLADTARSPLKEQKSSDRTPPTPATPQLRSWTRDESKQVLQLLFESQFFLLAADALNVKNDPKEACKRNVIYNLIKRILKPAGIDVAAFNIGGSWGKILNRAINARKKNGEAGETLLIAMQRLALYSGACGSFPCNPL
jgi:hypothetical protein